jgi:hypothetical protein
MLNHTQQFGKLPSLAVFYYGVWQRGWGLFSTKGLILVNIFHIEFIPVEVLHYAKTTLKYHTGYKTN